MSKVCYVNKYLGSKNIASESTVEKEVVSELAIAYQALESRDFKQVIEISKRLLSFNGEIPQAHYLIARVTIETRQLDIALKALEKAVELDSSISEYWAFLALVHSQTGNLVKAESAVWTAHKLGSDKAYVLHPIAHVFSVLGLVEEASDNLQKATQISPDSSIYHRALGVCQLETGDLEGAQQSLNKAVVLNENDAESWWVLSSLIKAKDNLMAEKLVAIMKNAEALPRHQAYLGYAAGKLFEDTKSWEQAFAAFGSGATAKRCLVDYDVARAQKTFEALKRVCTDNWLHKNVNEYDETLPIFIIGQPRTGTTLIDRIISSHSLVHSAGEPLQLAMSLRAITGIRTKEFISA